ncbi:restriction endonuclease subunit S [Streptosporangium sp. NBC_01810]|uniref:restriction endonuclease subunit S n=1 Tax=Streptosporangium sp. NBC_01810 TaxID=2975951 RepID=UPI002DDA107E|nr:restriction endonuclease subunit S [Streptosporangium sp. NBC_01810]WSA23099.1 restriction endonuclease subunit S [Streptosporangium sp. NBC_01810]
MRELPEGWTSMPLLECGTWMSGGTPSTDNPSYWGGDIPWISAASLKDFYIRDSERRITSLGARSGTRMAPKGAVLFVVRGMSLKTEFRVGVTQRELSFGQDCKAIIPRPEIDGTFLGLALKTHSSQVLGMVDEAGHGTGRLPIDMLSRLSIDIPSKREQQNILNIFESIDARISATGRIIAKLERINTGIKHREIETFLWSAQNSRSLLPLSAIAEIRSGVTLGSEPHGTESIQVPYLRVANVQDGHIDTREVKTIRIMRNELTKYLLLKGDVLLTEGGDFDKLGRGAVWDARISECISQNHIFRVRCDQSRLIPEFLSAYTSSHHGKRYFLSIAKQTTNLATINSTQLKSMPIPVPSLEVQKRLVNALEAHSAKVTTEKKQLKQLMLIKQGLMKDLLTGKVRANS